ncbi:BTAD domain-containing putative transcriptional regulator [Dactylosporangium sp. NPDC049525]|uniref:AfsR/SARP family transcriptional regulator n=1 Tax=Dactylosporangium sp. NPDC049525 TaxID=3154730 RepID=UPI003422244C
MRFRLLGPFVIDTSAGPVVLRRRRERCLLAVLLLHNHVPVPVERLAYLLWDGEPVPTARQQLHSHVSRVRAALRDAAALLSSTGTSYQIDVDDDAIDARRFNGMVAAARARTDPAERGAQLRAALDLWRGDALDDTVSAWLRPRLVGDLDELRLVVTEEWLACELAAGRHVEALPELTRLAAAHPTREGLLGLSMRALDGAGRGLEALEVYRRHQQRLAREFGLDPGPELQRLHLAVLRGHPAPAAVAPASRPVPRPVPAQLPPAVRGFTGRGEALAKLDALAAGVAPNATVICTVAGTAGVGKTTLVVHWAHRVADRFPDGQLYVNLRGFDRTAPPTDPAEAIRGFLDALDVAPQRVPVGLEAQVALYRSHLAGRRMLLVLDNARDSEQVRPLLPGAGGCVVLVTSRNELSGLHTSEGAEPLLVDLLPHTDARWLLAARLGAGRVADESAAVDEIVESCAGLPLALAIVAARAAGRPAFALADVAASLRQVAGRQLDAFTGAERDVDARAVLSWSYAALSPAAARMFRLLGLHPGPDVTGPAAAGLTGGRDGSLAELVRANLLTEHVPGRYTFHDLLRAYAAEQVEAVDPPADRLAAQRRTLDHYLHTAYAGTRLLSPHRETLDLEPSDAQPEPLADARQSLAWFTAERPVLLAAIDQAARSGFDRHAWQLSWALATFLDRQGLWRDWLHAAQVGLAAAERLTDRRGAAHSHRLLAHVSLKLNRTDDAQRHATRALELYRELGDHGRQAQGHLNLAEIAVHCGQYEDGFRQASLARDLFRAAASPTGEANALNAMGWLHAQLGDHRMALATCRQALTLHQELSNRQGEAETWDSIGFAHHQLHEHEAAISCFQRALALFEDTGDRCFEADTLHHLGDSHLALGDVKAARDVWRRSLDVFESVEHPDAAEVRTKLADVTGGVAGR